MHEVYGIETKQPGKQKKPSVEYGEGSKPARDGLWGGMSGLTYGGN
ncbi:MAG: hypothetical protein NTAFB09_10270 [Nitrosospira sp.]